MNAAALLVIAAYLSDAQINSGKAISTRGNCSPIVTGSGNTIKIKTCGSNREENERIRALFREILTTQRSDTDTILKRLDGCLQALTDRHLDEAQKKAIYVAIAPFEGQSIRIYVPSDNSEAASYATDFVKLFKNAKWLGIDDGGLNRVVITGEDPIGVKVLDSKKDAQNRTFPPGMSGLIGVLHNLGLAPATAYAADLIDEGTIGLMIGKKEFHKTQ